MRLLFVFLLAAALCFAETFKLYLKDGDYQMTREYKVEGDRVRYYSTERGQWEEIPTELCDLKKTEAERQSTRSDSQKEAQLVDDEEKLERAQKHEVERIPMNPGAYVVVNDQVKTLAYAEAETVTNKRRQVLQKITPLPVVSGKAKLQIKGEHAAFTTANKIPEFYLRLEGLDRFSIVELTPGKGVRVVEDLSLVPVSNEVIENPKQLPTFQKEMMTGLYKVWPEKPLPPGEYALIEYTGEQLEQRIWDFAVQPAP